MVFGTIIVHYTASDNYSAISGPCYSKCFLTELHLSTAEICDKRHVHSKTCSKYGCGRDQSAQMDKSRCRASA